MYSWASKKYKKTKEGASLSTSSDEQSCWESCHVFQSWARHRDRNHQMVQVTDFWAAANEIPLMNMNTLSDPLWQNIASVTFAIGAAHILITVNARKAAGFSNAETFIWALVALGTAYTNSFAVLSVWNAGITNGHVNLRPAAGFAAGAIMHSALYLPISEKLEYHATRSTIGLIVGLLTALVGIQASRVFDSVHTLATLCLVPYLSYVSLHVGRHLMGWSTALSELRNTRKPLGGLQRPPATPPRKTTTTRREAPAGNGKEKAE